MTLQLNLCSLYIDFITHFNTLLLQYWAWGCTIWYITHTERHTNTHTNSTSLAKTVFAYMLSLPIKHTIYTNINDYLHRYEGALAWCKNNNCFTKTFKWVIIKLITSNCYISSIYKHISIMTQFINYSQPCLSRICWDWRNSFDLEKIRLMRG